MASLVPTIRNNGFQNWLRGALALLFAKQVLEDFVTDEITHFQVDLLKRIFTNKNKPFGTVCNTCTTENVLPCPAQNFCPKRRICNLHDPAKPDKSPNQVCPNNICHDIREAIRREHRYNGPSWKNTNASKWCTNGFEIAKCYMTSDGYSTVTTFADTDFNGILAVIINNKRFQNKMAAPLHQSNNVCIEAREVGRVIRHSANLSITDTDLAKHIDTLIDLLSDPKNLAADKKAQEAVNKLNQLKSNQLTIATSDIISVIDIALNDIVRKQRDKAIQAISAEKEEAKAVIEEKINESHKLLRDVKDSLANTQTVTLSALDQISAATLSALRDIKNVSEKEKQDVATIGAKERQRLIENIETVSQKEKRELAATGTKERQLATEEIKHLSEKEKRELLAVATKERELIREEKLKLNDCLYSLNPQTEVSNSSQTQENRLRQDLITFYRDYHNTIPIAPLVEEHDVTLVDFYVQPPLTATYITLRQFEESPTSIPLHSYRNLFLREDGDFYKNIYITARAGIGKTSFSKRICMAWCQAHKPREMWEHKFEKEDLKILKQFEFLFFIPLRDTDASECEVDKMIFKQIIGNLKGSHRYMEYFIKDVLQDRSCLIILDGLDEWTHAESCERRYYNAHKLPLRPAREYCSVITTTRPWKLDVAQVSLNKIDRLVEINELNESSSNILIANAVNVLNKQRPQSEAKSVKEFQETTSSRNLDTIRYIPYILLQIICLWFDGKSVGKSKCEIYSNILELTFIRGLMKTDDSILPPSPKQQAALPASIPACLSSNESCTSHYDIVLNAAKLAFETLFTLNKESSIVFSKDEVMDSISKAVLQFLLQIGLISQNKDYGRVACRQSKCAFQHKSVQEYLAALYIYSKPDSQLVQQRIGQVCNTLATVLEMSNVFVFLGGFSSETCGKILQMLQNTVSSDREIKYYRCKTVRGHFHMPSENKCYQAVKSFQTMQSDIVQEIINNERSDFPSHTEDIIIQHSRDKDSFYLLKPLIANSKAYIKSLCIEYCSSAQELSEVLDTFDLQNVKFLQKLTIRAVPRQQDLQRFLSESVDTLVCLKIKCSRYKNNRHYSENTNIAPEIVKLITNMDHLLSLSLGATGLTHPDIEALFNYLSKRTMMTEIVLVNIFCTSGGLECNGYSLDLSQHQKLKRLEINVFDSIPVSKLCVNASSLETCFIGRLLDDVYTSLFKSLLHATSLRVLVLEHSLHALKLAEDTMPNLINLKEIQILRPDLGNNTFTLPSDMKLLEHILLYKVKMTSSALRHFIDSVDVLPQSVTIKLQACTVHSEKEYQQLKGNLRYSQKCRIISDAFNARNQNVFVFQTVGNGICK